MELFCEGVGGSYSAKIVSFCVEIFDLLRVRSQNPIPYAESVKNWLKFAKIFDKIYVN